MLKLYKHVIKYNCISIKTLFMRHRIKGISIINRIKIVKICDFYSLYISGRL